jgi:archaellum component FlaC
MADNDDKRLERVENKLDKVSDQIGEINVTLSAQHESLKEHMRRTELLENDVEPLKRTNTVITFIYKIGIAILGSGVLGWIVKKMLRWD